jgi:predicted TIM-barrel fold metal-dependent hydrolase
MTPRIFGRYESIRRDYPAEEYIEDVTASGVAASVYVQPNWPLSRSVDEVGWVQRVYEDTGWPSAVVAGADMFAADAPDTFAAEAESSSLVRGIRQQLHWHEYEQFRFASAPDLMHDTTFRRNIAVLGELGWVFELQVFPGQMADAARFVADFPNVTFVLAHAGMLESLEDRHTNPWRCGLALLAAQPNVSVLLSGQGTFVHRVDREIIEYVTATGVELFGSRRCLFGTNLPVERIWTDAATLIGTWLDVLAAYPVDARRDILSGTARRVYRLDGLEDAS